MGNSGSKGVLTETKDCTPKNVPVEDDNQQSAKKFANFLFSHRKHGLKEAFSAKIKDVAFQILSKDFASRPQFLSVQVEVLTIQISIQSL